MHRLLDRVTELARSLKVTRGRKLRIDSTVVATAIHYPTDSRLRFDGVRVLSRLVQRATLALTGRRRRVRQAADACCQNSLSGELRRPRRRVFRLVIAPNVRRYIDDHSV